MVNTIPHENQEISRKYFFVSFRARPDRPFGRVFRGLFEIPLHQVTLPGK